MSAGLHRFFVPPGLLGGPRIALTGEQAHQISRVLRLKVGDRLVLLDGSGHEYRVRLSEVRSSAVAGDVDDVRVSRPEPRLHLTLYQALVLRDRFETVLQKGTEVGISRFVPVWCERSVVLRGDQIDAKRLERWRRIVTEAAEQCERGQVPEILPPVRFTEALMQAAAGPALLAWERERERSLQAGLRAVLVQRPTERDDRNTESIGLLVGPEGGFSSIEVAAARDAGVITVSLGPRILRTETAGPVLAALALYEAGDMVPFVHQLADSAAPERA